MAADEARRSEEVVHLGTRHAAARLVSPRQPVPRRKDEAQLRRATGDRYRPRERQPDCANCITASDAPWGSIRPAKRPIGMSIGSIVTIEPISLALAVVASQSAKQTLRVRRNLGREVLAGHLHHPGDRLAASTQTGSLSGRHAADASTSGEDSSPHEGSGALHGHRLLSLRRLSIILALPCCRKRAMAGGTRPHAGAAVGAADKEGPDGGETHRPPLNPPTIPRRSRPGHRLAAVRRREPRGRRGPPRRLG